MTKRVYLKSAYSSGFDLRTVTDCILKSVDFSQDCLERPDIWLVLGGSVLNNPENFLMQLLKEAFMDYDSSLLSEGDLAYLVEALVMHGESGFQSKYGKGAISIISTGSATKLHMKNAILVNVSPAELSRFDGLNCYDNVTLVAWSADGKDLCKVYEEWQVKHKAELL